MTKIIYIPLDDRPCNYRYPQLLAAIADDITMLVPPHEMVGRLKVAADTDALWQWLFANAAAAYADATAADETVYAILSVDMLIYGNLVNSRLHQRSMDEIKKNLARFEELREAFPRLHIHANNLVTRVAAYNNNFEDPEYWNEYGWKIWRYGWLHDRRERGLADEAEVTEMKELQAEIPDEIMIDFSGRREKNVYVNNRCIDFTNDGVFDTLVIPKDDTAEYGYASTVQQEIYERIVENRLFDRIMVYPGADEVGSVLLARVFCLIKNWSPRILIRYSSTLGPTIVPLYEDRPLAESLKAQITSAGGVIVDTAAESDMLFAVNSPGKKMIECGNQYEKDISAVTHVCYHEFFRYIDYYVTNHQKPCAIADVAYANGADRDMMMFARSIGIFEKISAYGGWNTSENTNGLCLAHLIIHSYYAKEGFTPAKLNLSRTFLVRKILEDYVYQGTALYEMPDEWYDELPEEAVILQEGKEQFFATLEREFGWHFDGKKVSVDNFAIVWGHLDFISFDVELE
ncbi:MAG: DUF4127 family protein [Lachnospiraceae bacterium]|jgi:hypothetical protein|nr:DUF4127 family protein [Lachnospiraceae bacterium]